MIYLEPRSILDEAISRIEQVIIYDYDQLIQCFEMMGMSYIEAVEHIEFNVISMSMSGWPIIEEAKEEI